MCFHFQTSECSDPWAGQLGDCGKWLSFRGAEEAYSRGHLLLSSHNDGFFVASGESSGAYHSSLALRSVYRTLILLDEELAVVVDFITTKSTSSVSKMATIFNNVANTFQPYKYKLQSKDLFGFQMTKEGRKYHATWISKEGLNPEPNITILTYNSHGKPRPVSNVNITWPIVDNHSLASFCFFSSNVKLNNLNIFERGGSMFLAIDVLKHGRPQQYNIKINSDFKYIRIQRTDKKSSEASKFLFYLLVSFSVLIAFKITCKTRRNCLIRNFLK